MNHESIRTRKRVIRRQYNLSNNNSDMIPELIPSNSNQQRHGYARKKSGGLICSICEGPAHGYNFDAITCESCKAFFRRNALRSDGKFRCRANDGKCIITVTTRKRCKACRLAKCFEKGMRADWILTEEERMNKRQKIEENRRLRQLLYPDMRDSDDSPSVEHNTEPREEDDDDDEDDSGGEKVEEKKTYSILPRTSLSLEDIKRIKQIEQAYADSVRLTSLPPVVPPYPHTTRLDAAWEMINLPANLHASRLIAYFKLLPEFSALNECDKLILIKYNTFALAFIRAALNYDRLTDTYHEPGTNDCVFEGKDLIQCFSLQQYEESTRCVCRTLDASQNDRVIIQIFLIIILFSKGSSMCTYIDEAEPIGQNTLSIYQTQNVFVDLLWRYCEMKFGYVKTINIWLKLVTSAIDAHVQAYNTRQKYVKTGDVVDQLVPLMKSVMLIV